jgi:hypothetical protein
MAVRRWRWTLVTVVTTATGLLLAGCAARTDASVVAACNADANAVDTAAQAYQGQTGSFPPSIGALTQTTVIGGQAMGPWLRAVPGTAHYTIFLDAPGYVYVYPPDAVRPAVFDRSHRAFDLGDPCASFAS